MNRLDSNLLATKFGMSNWTHPLAPIVAYVIVKLWPEFLHLFEGVRKGSRQNHWVVGDPYQGVW